jgi:uncharacterized protein YlxP (DUF503 family)
MNVGLCRVTFQLPENETLKGKRQFSRSLIDRVHNRFNVSIAEIENNDHHQILTLGVSCVSNEGRHANQVLSSVINFLSDNQGDGQLLDYEIEIVSAF